MNQRTPRSVSIGGLQLELPPDWEDHSTLRYTAPSPGPFVATDIGMRLNPQRDTLWTGFVACPPDLAHDASTTQLEMFEQHGYVLVSEQMEGVPGTIVDGPRWLELEHPTFGAIPIVHIVIERHGIQLEEVHGFFPDMASDRVLVVVLSTTAGGVAAYERLVDGLQPPRSPAWWRRLLRW